MPEITFADHPLHPQLIAGPLGLFPFSLAMDLMYLSTKKQSYADAAYYGMVGGYVTGMAAGAAGAADYWTIKPGTKTHRTANVHALLNLGAMGLYSLNLLMRRKKRTGILPTLLNIVGNAGLVVSSWYGGEMVYGQGMRVKPVSEGSGKELKLPGDQKIAKAAQRLEKQLAPSEPSKV